MYAYKIPEIEVRLQYKKNVELALVIALLLVTLVFQFSRSIEFETVQKVAPIDSLVVEEIPVTQQFKRPPPPLRPTIPVEDPEIPIEKDIMFDNIFDTIWELPAAPPPPAIDSEIIDFFAVEQKPAIVGGEQALMNYMVQHDLYPEMARMAGLNGICIIEFVVTQQGKAVDLTVYQEDPQGLGFGETGIKAIQAMDFNPGYQRDKAVSVRMRQVIRFKLK